MKAGQHALLPRVRSSLTGPEGGDRRSAAPVEDAPTISWDVAEQAVAPGGIWSNGLAVTNRAATTRTLCFEAANQAGS
ncbi:MAG: hypothetical protein ABW277_12405, partial [Longimicrobiaceae bacterium]